jgi:hypothetical protein
VAEAFDAKQPIERFVGYCDVAARDLLVPHGDVVIALSTLLAKRWRSSIAAAGIGISMSCLPKASLQNIVTLVAQRRLKMFMIWRDRPYRIVGIGGCTRDNAPRAPGAAALGAF